MKTDLLHSVRVSSASRILLLVLTALLFSGCVETRFESPLGNDIKTCDVRIKGLWVDPKNPLRPDSAAFVDEQCRVQILVQTEPATPLRQVHLPVNFVHLDKHDYLVIADAELANVTDVPPVFGVDPVPKRSFFFVRYRLRGSRLELTQVNTAALAKLVIDGKLDGTVSSANHELHVFIRGDRERMLDIVRQQPVFENSEPLVVKRRNQDIADYERDVLAEQRREMGAKH